MKKILIALLLLSSCSLHNNLDKEDKYMLIGSTALICVDWAQTKTFRAEGFKESNPILGKRPSQSKVDTYIGGGIVINYLVAVLLPSDLRKTYLNFVINSEYSAIKFNLSQAKSRNKVPEFL